jgi:hypothetical protein
MAELSLNGGDSPIGGSPLGSTLTGILQCNTINPEDSPSYQICKDIYSYHPLGAKLVEAPIAMAQSQQREIAITKGPEERVKKAFEDEWQKLNADGQIFNLMRLSRMYGIASIAILVDGEDSDTPLDYKNLWNANISFNVFDPLNTSGSLVLNQNPNQMDFLKTNGSITVQGQLYHRTRVAVKLNEEPVYLDYTSSAFGYTGRSVYQRTLFPLKSFLQSMITDDLVTKKAGVIVAKMKQPGSIVNAVMMGAAAIKRVLIKEAVTGNVINITPEDEIETLDLTNVNAAMTESRKNILNNIASGAGMPAILLNEETFAEGFGEGTEDAKNVARYVDRFREEMQPVYTFFDRICQYRAWNEEFYKTVQKDFPEEYEGRSFDDAFYEWVDSFEAHWPSLLTEPDSEKAKVDDVRLKAVIAAVEVLLPACDPDNKATVIEWLCDNFNAMELLFSSPLVLDAEALAAYEPPQPMTASGEPAAPKPFAAQDSTVAGLIKLASRRRE